jgi:hypothetical protein
MRIRIGIFFIIAMICFATQSPAGNEYSVRVDPATKERYFIFTSSKGNIRFNHDRHKSRMEAASCLTCHNTPTPTKKHTMTRLEHHTAHSFCRGCHRKNGIGPVECHECHVGN